MNIFSGLVFKNQVCTNEERSDGVLSPHNSAYVSTRN